MTWSAWLPLALVCALGAMSPGPSLAVVARHALRGGVGDGILCAMAHGVGILLWALLMANGLGVLMTEQPTWFYAVQLAGAGFLLYLGIRVLLSQSSVVIPDEALPVSSKTGAGIEGFVIALSNPKIALFFAALFSQFIEPDATAFEKTLIASTAAGIDTLWYALVSMLLAQTAVLARLQRHATLLNRLFGGILIVLAASVVMT
ncbi:LysE family translocator [Luminiphilus sp.]|jgi:threonine/homoserine/homoserine lactone efflux protein|nr:LysE family translocator [Luminiphilus sp.]